VRTPSLPSLLVTDWHVEPGVLAQAALCCLLYLLAVRRARGDWPRLRTLSFLTGVAAVVLAVCSGIDGYDDRLLSVHMVQHMILLLCAPLLLLIGRPVLLALKALPRRDRPKLARALRRGRAITGPLPCLAVFYSAVLVTHLPSFYDAALTHPALHTAEHGLYLLAGLMLWWPLLDGEPVPTRRLSGLGRLIYLIVAMLPMALVGAYLNRHTTVIYSAYAAPSRALSVNPLTDQAQAGAIMWVLGDVIMVAGGLWAALRALVAEERRQQLRDARALSGGLR